MTDETQGETRSRQIWGLKSVEKSSIIHAVLLINVNRSLFESDT